MRKNRDTDHNLENWEFVNNTLHHNCDDWKHGVFGNRIKVNGVIKWDLWCVACGVTPPPEILDVLALTGMKNIPSPDSSGP